MSAKARNYDYLNIRAALINFLRLFLLRWTSNLKAQLTKPILGEMVIIDEMPSSVVQSEGFENYSTTLEQRFELPSIRWKTVRQILSRGERKSEEEYERFSYLLHYRYSDINSKS